MVDFSVAIRLYNGASVLPEILDALTVQTVSPDLSWEIIIVDNNSTDGTSEIAYRYQQTWSVCSLHYVLEPCQGASFARRRAIQEARGTWVGFLDDDNIPAPDWVQSAYEFGMAHPQAAAFGGQIHPRYEVKPPLNFERIAPFIPVVERDEVICFTTGWRAMSNLVPPGAGLVILRQVWLTHVPYPLSLQGPVGKSLTGKGEDVEALLHLKKAAWEIWFNPRMHIEHQIPSWRFERSYLLRFFHGIGLSKYVTRMVTVSYWQRPVLTLMFMVNDGRKLLSHLFKYYRCLGDDDVAAAELQLLLSSLLGPFYAWRRWFTLTQSHALAKPSTQVNEVKKKNAGFSSWSHLND